MAAMGIPVNKASFSISNNLAKQAANIENDVKNDELSFDATNYPNPFNPTTVIKFSLPESGFVTLKVYNTLGQQVATLVNEKKEVGTYEVNFDASHLASGVYLYTLTFGKVSISRKMLLVR